MEGNLGTKELLAAQLKKQLRIQPLAKVTVAGLCRDVGITRQAFYYHFVDVYDLAVWTFETEVANHIMAHATYAQWAVGFQELLRYMKVHSKEVYAVTDSLGTRRLARFFYAQFEAMMQEIVTELEAERPVEEPSRSTIISHFARVVLGYLLHWLSTDMTQDPEALVAELEGLLKGQVPAAFTQYAGPEPLTR